MLALVRHRASPFTPLWSTPPVTPDDFGDVGHSWFGLLWAWIGGWVGRYFYATRAGPGEVERHRSLSRADTSSSLFVIYVTLPEMTP